MDRFLIKTSIGYPGHDVSVDILKQVDITDRAQTISPVLSGDDVMRLRQVATEIYVDDAIREYIVRLVEATRHNEKITVGSSMRGALALTRCARIWPRPMAVPTWCRMTSRTLQWPCSHTVSR